VIDILASNRRRANNKKNQREGSMPIQWTTHIAQAMQQHGASRKPRPDTADRTATAATEQKFQSRLPNQAEDAASRWTAIAAAPPSRP
jgi:hypothetical protein